MKIFITGTPERAEELKRKLPQNADVDYFEPDAYVEEVDLDSYDLIFDLNLDDEPEKLAMYIDLENTPVIVSSVKTQLAEMVYLCPEPFSAPLFGINALTGFIDRPIMEMSCLNPENAGQLQKICEWLGWEVKIVGDRVGMVSPRVILMIINEAFYTLQEGTASEADIDESMKLGTNYPYGPFEWCANIGIADVYETLECIYQDTHDERYKICPLLKTRYLQSVIAE